MDADSDKAPSKGIRGDLDRFMEIYPERRSRPFATDQELWGVLKSLEHHFRELPSVASRPTVQVAWGVGQGNWARVPWIAFLDSRVTITTRRGIYGVFLFREDMSGVYLTFNQGVTEPKKAHGAKAGLQLLQENASALRGACRELERYGFHLDDDIDLRTQGTLGSDYEAATIAHKLYERGEIPSDDEITRDLEALLSAYERHVPKGETSELERPIRSAHPLGEARAMAAQVTRQEGPSDNHSREAIRIGRTSAKDATFSAFISYATTADKKAADEIVKHLEASGLRCWIAPRNVRPGWEYASEIVHGIASSRCFILVLSQAANTSKFVRREVEQADRMDKRVYTLRIEQVDPSELDSLSIYVSNTQWIDAFTGDLSTPAKRLAEILREEEGVAEREATTKHAIPSAPEDQPSTSSTRTPLQSDNNFLQLVAAAKSIAKASNKQQLTPFLFLCAVILLRDTTTGFAVSLAAENEDIVRREAEKQGIKLVGVDIEAPDKKMPLSDDLKQILRSNLNSSISTFLSALLASLDTRAVN